MDSKNNKKIRSTTKCVAMSLWEYIDAKYDGNQRFFAKQIGVQPQQITQWLEKDFIVVDDVLYSRRRELKSNK